MKRLPALAGALALVLLAPLAGSAAGPPDVTCTTSFSGTARDLTVPAGAGCVVTGATITRDLILVDNSGAAVSGSTVGRDVRFGDESGADIADTSIAHDLVAAGDDSGADLTRTTIAHDLLAQGRESGFGTEGVSVGHDFVASGEESGADLAGVTVGHDVRLLGEGGDVHLERTTIGHDFFASRPQTVQTGHNGPDTPGGPVRVANDFTIQGSPGPDFRFVFDGMCDLHVGRDMSIVDRSVTLGIGLGSHCAERGDGTNTIGRDLIVEGNHALDGIFGPSALQVVENDVGRDLLFSGNTAVVPGGFLEVSGNTAGRNATCAANAPAVTVNAPNTAAGSNTCG
jgi:hypothetical protein